MEVVRKNSQEIKTGEVPFSSEYCNNTQEIGDQKVKKRPEEVLDQIEHFKFIDKNIHESIEHVK